MFRAAGAGSIILRAKFLGFMLTIVPLVSEAHAVTLVRTTRCAYEASDPIFRSRRRAIGARRRCYASNAFCCLHLCDKTSPGLAGLALPTVSGGGNDTPRGPQQGGDRGMC